MTATRSLGGIGARLFMGFGVVLLLLILIAGYGTVTISSLGAAFDGFGRRSTNTVTASDLQNRLMTLQAAIGRLSVLNTEVNRQEVNTIYPQLKADLAHQIDASLTSDAIANWTKIQTEVVQGYDDTINGPNGIIAIQAAIDTARGDVAGATAAMSGTVAMMLHRIDDFGDIAAISTIQDRVLRARMLVRSYQLTGFADEGSDALAALRDAERKFDEFDRMGGSVANHSLVKEGRKNLDALFTGLSQIRAAVTNREAMRLREHALEMSVGQQIQAVRDTTLTQMNATRSETLAAAGRAFEMATGAAALATLFGIGLAVVIGRGIIKPIQAMTGAMRRLANGELDVVVPGTGQTDEIGGMAGAMQVFKDAAIERMRAAAQTVSEREASDHARRRAEGEAAEQAIAGERAFVIAKFGAGLKALTDGELTMRIDETIPGEYETLRADFNAAMETLQDTLLMVSTNTMAIRSGTGEIASASDDLSRRTEQQAASLEETAAALDEITATVRKTAEGSSHARQLVGTAKQDAERSGAVVREAVDAMSGIERSAGQISQIIGVIDEIAFQTNLLALNAGVEAARAGDAGRGFAVVASEVRALAQRSADAAREIKALISASSAQVEQGVDLVSRTGEALERIVVQVAEINAIVIDIAASAQEQAMGLDQVNTAINQMDQVTQQNAAMVEQSTAASQALAQETEQLTRLIGRFNVGRQGHEGAGRPAPRRAAPARPAKPGVASKFVAALKTVGRGGAAVARKPEISSDDWQEF